MAVLASGEAPAFLLNAMLALVAPLSMHPAIQPEVETESRSVRTPWRAGIQFATAALAQLTGGNTDEADLSRFPGQELEIAQSLEFLSLHDTYNRRDAKPRSFHKQAKDILGRLSPARWDTQDTRSPGLGGSNEPATKAAWIRQECLRRTIWLSRWSITMASAVSLRARPIDDMELHTPLPIDEGLFDLSITEAIPPGNLHPISSFLSCLIADSSYFRLHST